jgi:hypothetical protein
VCVLFVRYILISYTMLHAFSSADIVRINAMITASSTSITLHAHEQIEIALARTDDIIRGVSIPTILDIACTP